MLITETGAGLAEAESYASVAAADTRCISLGLTAWAALTEVDKEIALRRATLFMSTYRTRWAGRRVHQQQALDFPRYGIVVDGFSIASNVVPSDVVNACIDLAVRSLTGPLMPDLSQAVKKKKVGPIEIEYALGTTAEKEYREIDVLLAPYFGTSGGSNSIRVTRC